MTPRGRKPASLPHYKSIAKMVSSPGFICITTLVSHLVYLTMAGKEKKGTKGKKKKRVCVCVKDSFFPWFSSIDLTLRRLIVHLPQ